GISAITTAHFNGSSVVVLGGRAPDYRGGAGSLQEFDHPVLLRPITKHPWTEHRIPAVGQAVSQAFELASAKPRRPVLRDVSLEALCGSPPPGSPDGSAGTVSRPAGPETATTHPGHDPGSIAQIISLIAKSQRPVLVLGSDVWLDGADEAARSA